MTCGAGGRGGTASVDGGPPLVREERRRLGGQPPACCIPPNATPHVISWETLFTTLACRAICGASCQTAAPTEGVARLRGMASNHEEATWRTDVHSHEPGLPSSQSR